MCLLALTMQAQQGTDSNDYVDLGLSSGTLWKASNEEGEFYTYEQAVEKYGDKLPTLEQWQKLMLECKWSWNDSGYIVTGPNGNSIVLPASGYCNCEGGVRNVGFSGTYWSSTIFDSEKAWFLSFDSHGRYINRYDHCYGYSVRLVQNK